MDVGEKLAVRPGELGQMTSSYPWVPAPGAGEHICGQDFWLAECRLDLSAKDQAPTTETGEAQVPCAGYCCLKQMDLALLLGVGHDGLVSRRRRLIQAYGDLCAACGPGG